MGEEATLFREKMKAREEGKLSYRIDRSIDRAIEPLIERRIERKVARAFRRGASGAIFRVSPQLKAPYPSTLEKNLIEWTISHPLFKYAQKNGIQCSVIFWYSSWFGGYKATKVHVHLHWEKYSRFSLPRRKWGDDVITWDQLTSAVTKCNQAETNLDTE